MTQHNRSLPSEKLLERVLRVAELLTLPVKPMSPDGQQPVTCPIPMISQDKTPSDNAAKTVKHHFQVK